MKDYHNVILSNPLFLKYCVVIIVDLFKLNPDFKQKVIESFPDLPKQSLNFNKNTSWNDSHILIFYINRNLKKFKNFLLNEYYRNRSAVGLIMLSGTQVPIRNVLETTRVPGLILSIFGLSFKLRFSPR